MLAIGPIATSTPFLETTMKSFFRLTFGLALLCAAMSTAAFASSIYFVQGVPGRDYAAATDPAFPLDILLNDGVCYVHGLAFGSISGPLTLAPGTYDVKISIADSLAPCTNTPLVDSTVTIAAESDYSAVISLNSSGTPTLSTFTNNLTEVTPNTARVLFAQTTDAASVQVIFENTASKKLYTYTVKAGSLLDITLPAGAYTVEVNNGTTVLVGSTDLHLYSLSANLLFAIGEAKNGSVVLETKTLRDVI
jgi:hypothetical protein